MRQSWKKSSVMDWYSASDHLFLLHEFSNRRRKPTQGGVKYSRKNVDEGNFLRRFDENLYSRQTTTRHTASTSIKIWNVRVPTN